jgi:hypothetical protein
MSVYVVHGQAWQNNSFYTDKYVVFCRCTNSDVKFDWTVQTPAQTTPPNTSLLYEFELIIFCNRFPLAFETPSGYKFHKDQQSYVLKLYYNYVCFVSYIFFIYENISCFSRDSEVGIVTGYGLDDRGVAVRVLLGPRIFFHVVQTGSGAHPASYPMGTWGSFPGGKAAGTWSWPLTSS